jgi:hypothetical protein
MIDVMARLTSPGGVDSPNVGPEIDGDQEP